MSAPYPIAEPYDSGYFDTGDGHQLYYERHGNPQGRPVVPCMAAQVQDAATMNIACLIPHTSMSCCSTSAAPAKAGPMPV